MPIISLMFQAGLGAWLENHIAEILTFIISGIGLTVWLVRLEAKVAKTYDYTHNNTDKIEELEKGVFDHITNRDLHVNLQYMKSIEKRLDNLEQSITRGFEKASEQLNKLAERLYGSKH